MLHLALDAVAAGKGDALVLRWSDDDGTPHLALIDGGPSPIWERHLHPHLVDLVGRDLADVPRPVVLDLVVVSHVDDDHIHGIIDMVNAIGRARDRNEPPPVTVHEVWHNAFSDVALLPELANDPQLRQAITDAAAPQDVRGGGSAAALGSAPAAGAQSVTQGRVLDRSLRTTRLTRNRSFATRGGFVRAGPPLPFAGLTVTVVAPDTAMLEKLRARWREDLDRILQREGNRYEAGLSALAASFTDRSVPNQSSIVLLVELAGRRLLLTGDARGDQLLDALAANPAIDGPPFHVDLLKVPHHGSRHSNGRALFEAVTADHYVISGNGEHGNPHPEVLTDLFASQAGRPITVHLTHRPTEGAVREGDRRDALAAERILARAEQDGIATIRWRNPGDRAVSVALMP